MPSLVEIGPVVLEKKFLNFVNVFSLFRNYFPLEKGVALYFNKLESPSSLVCWTTGDQKSSLELSAQVS